MIGDSRPATRFRPGTRRRNRLAAGLVLAALAIGGNVLIYSSLDDTEPAVQVVRDVPAGALITPDMLRTVDVDVDPSVNIVHGADLATLIGTYAKVRLVSGSLVARQAVQSDPLVTPGNAIVAITVSEGQLPTGLRERVPVRLVIPGDRNAESSAPVSVDGRVVGLPIPSANSLGTSVSIEVAQVDAPTVASSDEVRVVLLVPSEDPASVRSDS